MKEDIKEEVTDLGEYGAFFYCFSTGSIKYEIRYSDLFKLHNRLYSSKI